MRRVCARRGGKQIAIRREVDRFGPQLQLAANGFRFVEIDAAGNDHFIFGALCGRKIESNLAKVKDLFGVGAIEVKSHQERSLGQFSAGFDDKQVRDHELALQY